MNKTKKRLMFRNWCKVCLVWGDENKCDIIHKDKNNSVLQMEVNIQKDTRMQWCQQDIEQKVSALVDTKILIWQSFKGERPSWEFWNLGERLQHPKGTETQKKYW